MADAGAPMTLRLKIILTLLIGTAVLFASFTVYKVATFLQARFGKESEQTKQENGSATEQDAFFQELGRTDAQAPAQQPTPVPANQIANGKVRADLLAIALPFAERFGSYSNQASYANLEDLMPFMTDQMRAWAHQKLDSARAGTVPALYKGVTTKALAQTVLSLDEEKETAQVRVSTQRKELVGTDTNFKVYNQELLLTFEKQDGVWLVDSAVWQ